MNKYFIQLFLKEKMVLIPGFGVLTMLSNDLTQILFSPDTTSDDGKLVNYICETEGIDEQTAQNMIAKFTREIESNLNKGESFDIFEFGSFRKNETGLIIFDSWLVDSSNQDIASASPKVEFEEKQISSENIEVLNDIPVESPKAKEEAMEKSSTVDESREKESMDSVALIQALLNGNAPEKIVHRQPPVKEQKIKAQPDSKKEFVPKVEISKPLEKKISKKEVQKEKKKKRKFPFWIFILFLVLASLSFLTWYNFDSIKPHIPFFSKEKKITESKDSIYLEEKTTKNSVKKKRLTTQKFNWKFQKTT